MMEPSWGRSRTLVAASLSSRASDCPTVTGEWLTAGAGDRPGVLGKAPARDPVRFSQGGAGAAGARARHARVGPRADATRRSRASTSATRPGDGRALEPGRPPGPGRCGTCSRPSAGCGWRGSPVDSERAPRGERRRRVPLPTYPFERKRLWVPPIPRPRRPMRRIRAASASAPLPACLGPDVAPPLAPAAAAPRPRPAPPTAGPGSPPDCGACSRRFRGSRPARRRANAFLETGTRLAGPHPGRSADPEGLGVKVTFRQMMESLPALGPGELPGSTDATRDGRPPTPARRRPPAAPRRAAGARAHRRGGPRRRGRPAFDLVQRVIDQQLLIMHQQLAVLAGARPFPARPSPPRRHRPRSRRPPRLRPPPPRRCRRTRRPPRDRCATTPRRRSARSRASTRPRGAHATATGPPRGLHPSLHRADPQVEGVHQRYRGVHADPRAVTGFRPAIKEIIYPIVMERPGPPPVGHRRQRVHRHPQRLRHATTSAGSRTSSAKRCKRQIDLGIEIGPQHPLAGEVARAVLRATRASSAPPSATPGPKR